MAPDVRISRCEHSESSQPMAHLQVGSSFHVRVDALRAPTISHELQANLKV